MKFKNLPDCTCNFYGAKMISAFLIFSLLFSCSSFYENRSGELREDFYIAPNNRFSFKVPSMYGGRAFRDTISNDTAAIDVQDCYGSYFRFEVGDIKDPTLQCTPNSIIQLMKMIYATAVIPTLRSESSSIETLYEEEVKKNGDAYLFAIVNLTNASNMMDKSCSLCSIRGYLLTIRDRQLIIISIQDQKELLDRISNSSKDRHPNFIEDVKNRLHPQLLEILHSYKRNS